MGDDAVLHSTYKADGTAVGVRVQFCSCLNSVNSCFSWLLEDDLAPCSLLVFLQGVGTAEDIDKGMRLGTNQPMGPLRLGDFIGKCFALLCGSCPSCNVHVQLDSYSPPWTWNNVCTWFCCGRGLKE